MASDLRNTTTSDMTSQVKNHSVTPVTLQGIADNEENNYDNEEFSQRMGYYKIAEVRQIIKAYVRHVLGLGFETDTRTRAILEHIQGDGKQTIHEILENFLEIYVAHGSSYAEIIRDDNGDLLNLKVLNPQNMRVVYNSSGMVKKFIQRNRSTGVKGFFEKVTGRRKDVEWKPEEMFFMKVPLADQLGGETSIDTCAEIITFLNEVMADWRRLLHRSSLLIAYIDNADTARMTAFNNSWGVAVNKGEVLVLPGMKGKDVEFERLPPPPSEPYLSTIRMLEDRFYRAFGVNPSIAGNTEGQTEASSKTALMLWEITPIQMQKKLEAAIWNQLYIKLEFVKAKSIMPQEQAMQAANTGQLQIQPNEGQVQA